MILTSNSLPFLPGRANALSVTSSPARPSSCLNWIHFLSTHWHSPYPSMGIPGSPLLSHIPRLITILKNLHWVALCPLLWKLELGSKFYVLLTNHLSPCSSPDTAMRPETLPEEKGRGVINSVPKQKMPLAAHRREPKASDWDAALSMTDMPVCVACKPATYAHSSHCPHRTRSAWRESGARVCWGLKGNYWQVTVLSPWTVLYLVTQFSSVQLLSPVWLFAIPWTAAHQPSLSITNSQSLPKLMSIESVMPSNHFILRCPLLLLPSIFPSISHVQLFVTPWTVACQAPLSMGFSRQEYWSGLPCPPPGDLPNPGINGAQASHIAGGFFIVWATREAFSLN